MNGDKWLILFSKHEPVASRSEMSAYAHRIAQALEAGACVSPPIQVFIANFLQSR